jgi:RNA polymerase sigma-70 factor, ECF subfamily
VTEPDLASAADRSDGTPDWEPVVARARGDDERAWEELYRHAYPRLLAFAERRLDHDRAREAVAETMARAVAGIDRYQGTGSGFDGWLFGILRHVVVDAHRAAGRRPVMAPVEEISPEAGPYELLRQTEEHAELRRAFATLPARDRQVLELRVVGGLGVEETAAALGKRPGAVRMAQSRALSRLRKRLEQER